MSSALYHREGGLFVPTDLTRSPWERANQHAGPPAALLIRALERAAPEMAVNRFTMEVLGPIPLRPVSVRTEVIRSGRRIRLIDGRLITDEGAPVVIGRGWMVRRRPEPIDFGPVPDPLPAPPPGPDDSQPFDHLFVGIDYPDFFGEAIETRLAEGTVDGPGSATVWFRHRVPVVAGEDPSSTQRIAAVADSANGISWIVPPADTLFVNLDLTLYFWREPIGEWHALRSVTRVSAAGRGISDSLMFDRHGVLGRSNQGLFIEPR